MKREFRWDLKSVLIMVATVIGLEVLLEVTDFGERMSGLSSHALWQFTPWILLVLLWIGFAITLRRHHSSK